MINFGNYTKAKVMAHWMPWWGSASHIKLNYTAIDGWTKPYDERDVDILDDQVARMKSAGIFGVNADYYGPESYENLTSLKMLSACERGGIKFSLSIDQGAFRNLNGTTATQEYIRILQFCANAFFSSPAYLTDANRAVVTFFGEPSGVDWNAIRNAVGSKIAFFFQDSGGFTHAQSNGAFGWVHPTTPANNWNQAAIQTFINGANASPTLPAMYPVYPGFDDAAASWGSNRFMSRRAGRTLRDTLAMVPVSAQYVMLATWNDHEEGSGIEETTSIP